jgi:hypothetical protein
MSERVVAVTKRPRREISGCGCFAIATTLSGLFSLIERFHCLSVTHTQRGWTLINIVEVYLMAKNGSEYLQ